MVSECVNPGCRREIIGNARTFCDECRFPRSMAQYSSTEEEDGSFSTMDLDSDESDSEVLSDAGSDQLYPERARRSLIANFTEFHYRQAGSLAERLNEMAEREGLISQQPPRVPTPRPGTWAAATSTTTSDTAFPQFQTQPTATGTTLMLPILTATPSPSLIAMSYPESLAGPSPIRPSNTPAPSSTGPQFLQPPLPTRPGNTPPPFTTGPSTPPATRTAPSGPRLTNTPPSFTIVPARSVLTRTSRLSGSGLYERVVPDDRRRTSITSPPLSREWVQMYRGFLGGRSPTTSSSTSPGRTASTPNTTPPSSTQSTPQTAQPGRGSRRAHSEVSPPDSDDDEDPEEPGKRRRVNGNYAGWCG